MLKMVQSSSSATTNPLLLRIPVVLLGSICRDYLDFESHLNVSVASSLIHELTTNRRTSARSQVSVLRLKYFQSALSLRPLSITIWRIRFSHDKLQLLWKRLASYNWIEELWIEFDKTITGTTTSDDWAPL
jgi:hypothetical protein